VAEGGSAPAHLRREVGGVDRTAVEAAAEHHGAPDILVNSLGVQHEQPLLEVTEEASTILAVNLKAAMFLGQAVARVQIAGGAAASTCTNCRCAPARLARAWTLGVFASKGSCCS
jgi:NAD(P)-dependent dehydrogenase (short-subunit alcohol dehydrogenase family)